MNKNCDICGALAKGRKAKRYADGKKLLCFSCSLQRSQVKESANKKLRTHMQRTKIILIKDRGSQCEKCGAKLPLRAHHKQRLMDGGTNDVGNIELLCDSCHRKAHEQGTRW